MLNELKFSTRLLRHQLDNGHSKLQADCLKYGSTAESFVRSQGFIPQYKLITSTRTSEQLREIRTTAIEHMADISLHRRLTLPSNPKAGRSNPLKVTFADVGAKPSGGQVPDPPVLLIASAMSGGRLHAAWIGELAKSYGVRVVCIDKPGMGGSDPVPIEQQTPLWLGMTC